MKYLFSEAYNGNLNNVKILVQEIVDVNNHNEPIIRAVIGAYEAGSDMLGTYCDIIKYLIEQGADINIKDLESKEYFAGIGGYHRSAIAWACKLEIFEIVDLLIKSGKIGKDLADAKEIYTGLLVNELCCDFNYKGRKELEHKFKIIDLVVDALAKTVFKLNNLN